MLFNSFTFMLFFPLAVLSYYIVPKKVQNIWLLILNYYFYMRWNAKYGLLLLGCTLITYFAGIAIESTKGDSNEKKSKKCLIIAIVGIAAVLCVYKYTNFVVNNMNIFFGLFKIDKSIQAVDVVLPVGISFFSLQAIGYLVDVYRGGQKAEYNFIRYALFISFFPQILSGPIERGEHMLHQFETPRKFDYEKARHGVLLMIFGYFLKLVIADRAAFIVNNVYGNYWGYTGAAIVLATVIYALQIYCDFYGYSTIALGTAKALGIDLIDNFNCPYFSQSTQEFWRRWHISLSTWLRDYIYFPLGGSRCSKKRSYINLIITFLVSGLWHGSKWTFIAWGLINGLYQAIGKSTRDKRKAIATKLSINTDTPAYKVFRMIITFILMDFTWLVFRIDRLSDLPHILKHTITNFDLLSICAERIYNYGLDVKDFQILLFGTLVLLFADICKYRGIKISEWICKQNWLFRVGSIVLPVLFIALVGIWGNAYNASSFIYFKF